MSRRTTYRSVALLLAFLLGGIVTPLAHQIDHLFEEQTSKSVPLTEVSVIPASSVVHECELCEVRLFAAHANPGNGEVEAAPPAYLADVSEIELTLGARAFDGRAPPARA